MDNISNNEYKTKETAIFKLNFLSLIDKIISSILPIEYEFPLEKIETNIKEEQEYQQFIYSILIPKLEQFINENYSYYKIIAIEQKMKYDKIISGKEINTNEIKYLLNNNITIKLNEKGFQEIRNDILNRLFIEFINKSNEKNYVYNFLNENEYFDLLTLKNIISYNKINNKNTKLGKYEYKIFLSFKDYIKIVNNNDLFIQFKFWICFFMKKMNLRIIEIEYEYYTNLSNEEIKNEIIKYEGYSNIKNILSSIFIEYLNFVFDIINYTLNIEAVHKTSKCKLNLNLIDNINFLEYLEDIFGKDFLKTKEIMDYNENKMNNFCLEKLIFNNICIKLYGKYSTYNFKNLLDNIHINKIENIQINISNFNDYEYFELIQNDENIIKEIKRNAIKIFSFLSKFLIKIKKSKLKSIVLFIKGFNNNILSKEIKDKFDLFMKEIIKQNNIVKNLKIFFSNIFSEGKEFKSDSIYNFSCINEYYYNRININNSKKNQFDLLLFDNNINIRKNKIIDFYFFENYSLKKIQHLCLGYFFNISELNRFLKKIKLNELWNMKKFTCFMKSNYKINEKSLTTFFKLDWPKNTLNCIKIIFENFVKYMELEDENINKNSKYNKYSVQIDMYTIYNSIIKEHYFKTESKDDINKLIKDDLEGSMLEDKRTDKSLEQKLNIIKFKKNQDENMISTKNLEDNNTNMSYIQQSNNMFLQTKEGSIDTLLKNKTKNKRKFHYINDIRSVEECHNNNYYNFTYYNKCQKYPLKYFYIIQSETYLKYFTNINKENFLKNALIYNELIEVDNIGKKTEEKYKTYLNFKKSLLIINNSISSIFALIFALNKTKNKNLKKLINNKLRYKLVYYQYYQRIPVLLDYIISFMNNRFFIYNDFKHSNRLFKKLFES